jgi:starch-binding outer membrane protein, SusD/RagB family
MKTYKYILRYIVITLLVMGCTAEDLDFLPINQLTTDEIINDPELIKTASQGNYSYFRNWSHWRSYDRNRYDGLELMSDNLIMMRWSGDHLTNTLTYLHIPNSTLATNLWQHSYYAIYSINVVIEALNKLEMNAELRQMKGENLWMRAMFHFDLARAFARPYSHDSPETNLGVMLRDDTDVFALPARATVKETYEFIEKDLLEAAELMTVARPNIYVSKEVAYATLARLYLYMEQNEKAIEYADMVINSGRYSLVTTEDLPTMFRLGPERNPETIFAVKIRPDENRGQGAMGTMYHGDGGWGEIMASTSYMDLIFQNPNDQRIHFITPHFRLDANGEKIPDPTEPYYGYAVNDRMGIRSYWHVKLTYEYDLPMLHSPIYFRLGEMYLIKAEAYAKLDNAQLALDNVNIIRQRAGLSGDQLFTPGNLKGYPTVLDVVLDERRLELAWEAHRPADVFRNKRTMDRSYKAWQGWSGPSSIPYTSDRIIHLIPEVEMTRNPNLVQNPTTNY